MPSKRATNPLTGQISRASAWSNAWRQRRRIRTTIRQCQRVRGAGFPAAFGTISAWKHRSTCRCHTTVRSRSWSARLTSVAAAPRWGSWRPKNWASPTRMCASPSPTPDRSATTTRHTAAAQPSPAGWPRSKLPGMQNGNCAGARLRRGTSTPKP